MMYATYLSASLLKSHSIKRSFTKGSIYMMPEGPEVRSLVDSLSSRFEGKSWQLKGASLISGRYERDEPPNWKEMMSKLPVKVEKITCKGKFIYFQCGDFYIFNTLGLSGGWSLSPSKAYNRVSLELENHERNEIKNLYFYDMIGYGTVKICLTKKELDEKLKKVGTCWLEEKPSFHEFLTKIKKTKPSRPLVVFLMDQTKLAGIGNYILSEVLYRARIHPWALCGDLDEVILREIYNTIAIVINTSYLSQQPGNSYYPNLIEKDDDDHNGLIKDIIDRETEKIEETFENLPVSSPVVQMQYDEIWYTKECNSPKFRMQAYGRSECPLGNIIVKEEGLHKRSIHWVESIQVKFKPEGGIPEKAVKIKKTRVKRVKKVEIETI